MAAMKPPIILAVQSGDPYLEPDQPVLLHANGNLTCGSIVLRYDSKHRHYRTQYEYMANYLEAKGRPFDVSEIREPNIYDVIDRMQYEGRDSITREELIDLFSPQHQIYLIKGFMLTRLRRYADRRWWRERKAALEQGDNDRAKAMDEDFKAK